MKNNILKYCVFIMGLFFYLHPLFSQKNIEIIILKADSLTKVHNFDQARYHYELALRICEKDISCKMLKEYELESKLWKLDSLYAYAYSMPNYTALLRKADSLYLIAPVLAMRTFDEASVLVPSLAYPFNKINSIINTSPIIQKQLLVLQAKKQREIFLEKMRAAIELEKQNKKIEAYYRYKKIAQEYHDDENALSAAQRLETELGSKIAKFEELLNQANELYITEKYSKSKAAYQKALEYNSECKVCERKLANLDYFIFAEKSKKKEYDILKNEAKLNYLNGNYEASYYQLVALLRKNPADEDTQKLLKEVDVLVQSELDDKIKTFNAKLLLELANTAYMKSEFSKALQYYVKLETRYSDVIDYLSFVKARIQECEAIENINND